MPVTLAQAMVNAASDIDYAVIDDLRRYDTLLLDRMTFEDTVSPAGGGTFVYGYNRLITPASANTRQINSEYIPGKATRSQVNLTLKMLGASFEIDRVLRNLGQAATSEVTFQLNQATIGTRMKFNELVVLGDTAVDTAAFDGLAKILTGTSNANTTPIDIRSATITSQAAAMAALDAIDTWLSGIYTSRVGSGQGSMTGAIPPGERLILGNTASITRLAALARWAGIYTQSRDDLGRKVTQYGDWTLVNIGDRNDGSGPIIPTGVTGSGQTDVYAVSLGMDALHGVSAAGQPLVQTWLPDFSTSGAVKLGEVEMGPVALVLKTTKAAGVQRLQVV